MRAPAGGYVLEVKPQITRITVERLAVCPFSVAQDYAEAFLRSAEHGIDVRVPLRELAPGLGGALRRPVRFVFATHPDEEEGGRLHDALLVEWRAGTRLFPDFHGTLRLRIASVATTAVALDGAYRPPFGFAGRVFDALLGRHIARVTMRELLDRVTEAMEQRERAYRVASGSPA